MRAHSFRGWNVHIITTASHTNSAVRQSWLSVMAKGKFHSKITIDLKSTWLTFLLWERESKGFSLIEILLSTQEIFTMNNTFLSCILVLCIHGSKLHREMSLYHMSTFGSSHSLVLLVVSRAVLSFSTLSMTFNHKKIRSYLVIKLSMALVNVFMRPLAMWITIITQCGVNSYNRSDFWFSRALSFLLLSLHFINSEGDIPPLWIILFITFWGGDSRSLKKKSYIKHPHPPIKCEHFKDKVCTRIQAYYIHVRSGSHVSKIHEERILSAPYSNHLGGKLSPMRLQLTVAAIS